MDMMEKIFAFTQNYGSAFVSGIYEENRVLFANHSALKMYGMTEQSKLKDLFKVLENNNLSLDVKIKTGFLNQGYATFENIMTTKADGTKQLVHLMIGYFNEEKTEIFIELTPKQESLMEMALYQLEQSTKPEALFEYDDKLTLYCCNQPFCHLLNAEQNHCLVQHGMALRDYFVHPNPDELLREIHSNLKKDKIFRTEIQLNTNSGVVTWVALELQRRLVDETGEKLMCSMVSIDKQVELKEEVSSLHQYLDAFQAVSHESFSIIDLEKNTITHKGVVARELGIEGVMENFPECTFAYTHPDDLSNFKAFTRESFEGEIIRVQARMKPTKGIYQWYEISSQGIKDKEGNITQLIGKIANIQKQKEMQEEMTTFQRYFDVLQEFTDDILYRIDVSTQTLYHAFQSHRALRIGMVVPNYLETLVSEKIIHPDDAQMYIQNTKDWFVDETLVCNVRMNLVNDEYEWYSINRRKVFDENGNFVEIVGALVNIQKERKLTEEMTTMGKYFGVLQEFTDDILYRVDYPTQTMYHAYEEADLLKLDSVIPNYLDTLIQDKILHPDDVETFLAGSKAWHKDETVLCEVRLSLYDESYQWYSVKRRKVCDENGKPAEILGALVNIQKEREMEADYSELNQFFSAMQEMDDDVVFRIDLPTMTLYFDKQIAPDIWEKMEIPDFFNTFKRENQVHPEDREHYFRQAGAYFDGTVSDSDFACEVRFALVTDYYVWYSIKCKKIYNKEGIATEVYGKLLNIDTEKEITKGYSSLNQYFSVMQELSSDILFHIDVETMTFHHNDKNASKVVLSYDIPDFVNTFIEKKIVHPDCHESYRKDMAEMLSGRKMEFQVLSLTAPEVYEWYQVQGRFILNEQGRPVEIFGKMKNIQARQELERRAYHDLMTGALNKATFEEESSAVLRKAILTEKYALIFIDLDDFKSVNDTLGHSYGDALLTTVGKRLKRLVRGDDLVGRIGGDEFAVMLRNIDSEESVLVRTNLMLESLQRDFCFENKVVSIKASVGVSVYPLHGKTYKELIEKADKGVYLSKRRGKNVVSLYSEDL